MPPPRTKSGLLQELRRTPVNAYLRNALRLFRDLHHPPAFGDRQRQRLLHVHVLARPAGVDEHQGMPVVRCGDRDGVDIFRVEQLSVVVVFRGLGARLHNGEVHVAVLKIADSDRLLIAVFEKSVVHLIAAIAEPDVAHADAIVRADDPGITKGRGSSCGPGQVAPGKVAHSCIFSTKAVDRKSGSAPSIVSRSPIFRLRNAIFRSCAAFRGDTSGRWVLPYKLLTLKEMCT